jgi:predicted nucleic acid-binding protein
VSIYVDSSALLKLYFDAPDSDRAEELLSADTTWITASWVVLGS